MLYFIILTQYFRRPYNFIIQVRIQDVKEHLRSEAIPYRVSAAVSVTYSAIDEGSNKKARV